MNKLLIFISIALLIALCNSADHTVTVTPGGTPSTTITVTIELALAQCVTAGVTTSETCTINLVEGTGSSTPGIHNIADDMSVGDGSYVISGATQAVAGIANKNYQAISFAEDKSILTASGTEKLTLQHIGDITCATACPSDAVILNAVTTASIELIDVVVKNTQLAMTLVKTTAPLTVKGGGYKGKVGANGLFHVSLATGLFKVDEYTISSENEGTVFDTLTEDQFAIKIEHNAETMTGGIKHHIKGATFKSCTSKLVELKGQQLEFESVTISENETSGPMIQALKNTAQSFMSLNSVTFKKNKNTKTYQAATNGEEVLMRTNIWVKDSYVNFNGGTYEENEAESSGVFSVSAESSMTASTNDKMTFGAVRNEFVTTAPTVSKNKATKANCKACGGVGMVHTADENAFYKTEVDDTNKAKNQIVPKNFKSSGTGNENTPNDMFYFDVHVLGKFSSATSSKQPSNTISLSGSIEVWGTLKMEEELPALTFMYTDSFGNGLEVFKTFSESPKIFLWNRKENKKYEFSFINDQYSANVEAATTRRRILAGTWDSTDLAAAVKTHLEEASPGLGATYLSDADLKSTCVTASTVDWSLNAKAKWAQSTEKNSVTISGLQLAGSAKNAKMTWYWLVEGAFNEYQGMSKNYFNDSANNKKYYILPMMVSDNTCVDDNATATNCEVGKYLSGTTCASCDSKCYGCTGSSSNECTSCKDSPSVMAKNCCTSGTEIWDAETNACVTTTAQKTAVEDFSKSGTALTANQLSLGVNYYAAVNKDKVQVAFDKQKPCQTGSTECNAKGSCTDGKCTCDQTHKGTRCLYTADEESNYNAFLTKAVTLVKTTVTSTTSGTLSGNKDNIATVSGLVSQPEVMGCDNQKSVIDLLKITAAGTFDKSDLHMHADVMNSASIMTATTLLSSACTDSNENKKTRAAETVKIVQDLAKKIAENKQVKGTEVHTSNQYGESLVKFQDTTQTYSASITTSGPTASSVTFNGKLKNSNTNNFAALVMLSSSEDPNKLSNTEAKETISNVLGTDLYVDGSKVSGNFEYDSSVQDSDKSCEIKLTSQIPATTSQEKEMYYYDTTDNKWSNQNVTMVTTDTATATEIKATVIHFTDFALLKKATITPPVIPQNALIVIVNFSLIAILGLFAFMY